MVAIKNLSLSLLFVLLVVGCQLGQPGQPRKIDWVAACEVLEGLDASVAVFQRDLDPDSKDFKRLGEIRVLASDTIVAVCAVAENPDSSDPTPLIFTTLDLARGLLNKFIDDEDDRKKYMTAISGVEIALIGLRIRRPKPAPEVENYENDPNRLRIALGRLQGNGKLPAG